MNRGLSTVVRANEHPRRTSERAAAKADEGSLRKRRLREWCEGYEGRVARGRNPKLSPAAAANASGRKARGKAAVNDIPANELPWVLLKTAIADAVKER